MGHEDGVGDRRVAQRIALPWRSRTAVFRLSYARVRAIGSNQMMFSLHTQPFVLDRPSGASHIRRAMSGSSALWSRRDSRVDVARPDSKVQRR